jgi:hypothetical protein
MVLFALWLVFAVVVGVAADHRGRSGFGWFLLSVFISPLLAVLFLIALPNLRLEALLEEIRGQRGVNDRELERNIEKSRTANFK